MKIVLSLAIVCAALGFAPARAADSRMQACTAQWQQQGLARSEYRPFLIRCLKGETVTVTPAKPAKPQLLMAKAHPAKPKTVKTGNHPQANRMKQCGASWRQAKAAGTTGGQTWQQFASSCLKKK